MLYAIPRVSMRPLVFAKPPSSTIRRVWKVSSAQSNSRPIHLASRRAYATATAEKTRAVKATTKTTATKKVAPAKKTAAVKPAKTASKPKKKPAAKKKPVTKKPAPKKKVLSERQVEVRAKKATSDKVKSLKEAALLTRPKKLPISGWTVYLTEVRPGMSMDKTGIAELTKTAAAQWRSLSPDEQERYKEIGKKNGQVNEVAYKNWVSSFTPDEIRKANLARNALLRMENAKPADKRQGGYKGIYTQIRDDRQPKRPGNLLTLFYQKKWANGDFGANGNGKAAKDCLREAAAELRTLSDAQRKVLEDQLKADRLRYEQEVQTVFQ